MLKTGRFGRWPPAARMAGTPRHAGISGKKKGPETIRALQFGGGNDDLPQNSLKARAHRNSLIINAEVILHKHFPPTRPEKRFSPLISLHRTMVTGLQ